MEVFEGHVHGQANIQMIQNQTSFLFEIDFPYGDVQDKSNPMMERFLSPSNYFTLQGLHDTCTLTRSKFEIKALQGDHKDIMVTFEYHCNRPMELKSINLASLFELPSSIQRAQTTVIIGDQILPPVKLTKNNALIKLKKK